MDRFPLGYNTYSIRALRWNDLQLIEYASSLKLDAIFLQDDLRCELAPPASGERADHHGCRRAPADSARALHEQHRALREHERGVDSDRARRVRARRPTGRGHV